MKKPQLINMATGKQADTELVEAAPGVYVAPSVAPEDVPRYGICHLKRQADGSYIPVMKQFARHSRMAADLPERLGLEGLSTRTLYRLIAAGFIAHRRPAPNVILVDLASLAKHLEECADPDFWTPRRIALFRSSEARPTR